ncbi:MAG: hypothetical protein KME46_32705 [Brasilonema angustatum HA4187-MV1]|jgi:uncharacterized protein (DUF983 family)|nr:hypothetical protein [Brasilonema angustatum HA4187-MV1]
MKQHCPVCNQEKAFNYVARNGLENVYECDTCAFQDRKKTGKGWAATFLPGFAGGGVIGAALELMQSHHDDG